MDGQVFDRISVQVGTGYNLLSKEQWLAMPLASRVDLLSSGKVEFLLGDQIVDSFEALRSMNPGVSPGSGPINSTSQPQ